MGPDNIVHTGSATTLWLCSHTNHAYLYQEGDVNLTDCIKCAEVNHSADPTSYDKLLGVYGERFICTNPFNNYLEISYKLEDNCD
jgi:hypothetical protein